MCIRDRFIVQRELVKRIADAINKSIFNPKYKDVYLWGATNIFNFPEYHDIVKAKTDVYKRQGYNHKGSGR